MSYHSYNNLMSKVTTNVAADRPLPTTAADKPHMDRFENELNNAVNNGLEPDYVFKLTMLICLITEKGILPEVFQTKLNDVLNYLQQHPLDVSDEYIDQLIATVF